MPAGTNKRVKSAEREKAGKRKRESDVEGHAERPAASHGDMRVKEKKEHDKEGRSSATPETAEKKETWEPQHVMKRGLTGGGTKNHKLTHQPRDWNGLCDRGPPPHNLDFFTSGNGP